MDKRLKQENLYSLIKKVAKQYVPFNELDIDKQEEILKYIKNNNLNIKVFECKWFDILTDKFYTTEYILSDEEMYPVEKINKEFSNFEDFYYYVDGEIYENTCFYGYTFSKTDIERFHINIDKLNFDSFINETIDQYTFESINSCRDLEAKNGQDKINKLSKWLDKIQPFSGLKSLEYKCKQFTKKFCTDNSPFNLSIFFSILLRKDKQPIKDYVVAYFCKHNQFEGISFDDILLDYGKDVAIKAIEDFDGGYAASTKKTKIRDFKKTLEIYETENLIKERRIVFDNHIYLYLVRDLFFCKKGLVLEKKNYFLSFDEMVNFVDGNLCGANLINAPTSKSEAEKFKIDEKTKMPIPNLFDQYEIRKIYSDNKFIVTQKWFYNDCLILKRKNEFEHFFDFSHFLKLDLSNANLIMCDGIEKIKKLNGLKIDGMKVRSEIAKDLALPLDNLPKDKLNLIEFDQSNNFEIKTVEDFVFLRPEDIDYEDVVSYVTDIHLLHRFKSYGCQTYSDIEFVLKTIVKKISEEASNINLIGGDTSSDFDVFCSFIKELSLKRKMGHFFFTLGNHELWSLNNHKLDEIVYEYEKVLKNYDNEHFHLLHNNLFYKDIEWHEISNDELLNISIIDLKQKTRAANVIIFGGMGFAGKNEEFNANDGIYMNVINRDEEKLESEKFFNLYEKVTNALQHRNLIILTHMPLKDWAGEGVHAKENVVYVNGHNHRNYFYDNGKKRIFADNQIGYRGKNFSLKKIPYNFDFDWFADYSDGIYEINKDDYKNFYRGVGEIINFNRQFTNLYMIKKDNAYMFFMKSISGNLLILNGGSIKSAGNHDIQYFYDNLTNYAKSIKLFLSKYYDLQKQISLEVKKFGGDGYIHGSIIDIDFYNHIYLNPLDSSITPYFAYSMVDKYVYKNVPSLLKSKCPKLYSNYEKLLNESSNSNSLTIYDKNFAISERKKCVTDTGIYRNSRILKGLQYTTKHNIVRLWSDDLVKEASEKNGLLIVSKLLLSK